MKSYICILLSIVLIFSLSACKNNISTMNSSNIENNPSPSPIVNAEEKLMEYVGTWCESDISWEIGGLILDLYVEAGMLSISCSLISSAPDSKSAEIFCGLELEKIKSNPFELAFDDDGWGNSGILELNLNNNKIVANFKNIKGNSTSNWGFKEKKYDLIYNEYAYQLIEPDLEDITSNITQIDTSKASGILARMGMTEQEFRNICQPLRSYSINNWTEATRYDIAYGKQYYDNNPNAAELKKDIEYWNRSMENSKDPFSYYIELGLPYDTLEGYLSYNAYCKKGSQILNETTHELFEKIEEYPNAYVGKPYILIMTNQAYTYINGMEYYNGTLIRVTDRRDDTHNPNIVKLEKYLYYVVFDGTFTRYDGEIGLDFSLLSLEKIS